MILFYHINNTGGNSICDNIRTNNIMQLMLSIRTEKTKFVFDDYKKNINNLEILFPKIKFVRIHLFEESYKYIENIMCFDLLSPITNKYSLFTNLKPIYNDIYKLQKNGNVKIDTIEEVLSHIKSYSCSYNDYIERSQKKYFNLINFLQIYYVYLNKNKFSFIGEKHKLQDSLDWINSIFNTNLRDDIKINKKTKTNFYDEYEEFKEYYFNDIIKKFENINKYQTMYDDCLKEFLK